MDRETINDVRDIIATVALYSIDEENIKELRARVNVASANIIGLFEEFTPEVLAIHRRIQILCREIDCRVDHGAESNGHLEFVHSKLGGILKDFDNVVGV